MESKRPRRKHTDEFKQGAVGLVIRQGYTVSKAARSLDLHEPLLRSWLDRLAPDWRSEGPWLRARRIPMIPRSCASGCGSWRRPIQM